MGKNCCYGLCRSSSVKKEEGVRFIRFPQPKLQLKKCRRWAFLCGRKDFTAKKVTPFTYICSKHFPLGADLNFKRNSGLEPFPHFGKVSRSKKQPDLSLSFSSNSSFQPPSCSTPIEKTYGRQKRQHKVVNVAVPVGVARPEQIDLDDAARPKQVTREVQVDVRESETIKALKLQILELESKLRHKSTFMEVIHKSERSAEYYTGLTKAKRQILWNFLGDEMADLKIFGTDMTSSEIKFNLEEQFCIFFVKMKHDFTYVDLELRFGLQPRDLVGKVFKTWLQFLYWSYKDIEHRMFPRTEDIPKPLPRHFRNSLLRDTRVVIDCSEIFTEGSRNFEQQGNSFSNYKHHVTGKVLIGVAPSGAAVFVSHVYEGSISDKEIVKQSGFLDKINPNDLVLADRGFQVEEELREKGAYLNIPPFLAKRAKFTLQENLRTRAYAKARSHIERFNEKFKNWKFVAGTVKQQNKPMLTQAVYVACQLVNLHKILVK